jgi:hypothetical protein
MTNKVKNALLVVIRAEHAFNAEVAARVFSGDSRYQMAEDWACQEIEYLLERYALRDPDNADIHSFRAYHEPVLLEEATGTQA